MGPVLTTRKDERGISTGWIWRMILGVGLIGFSLWGIPICQGIFQTFLWPNPSPTEISFAKLAAEVAWFVIFGPVAAAGLAVLWFTLCKLGALNPFKISREERTALVYELHSGGELQNPRVPLNQDDFHVGLERLSEEEVARLSKRVHQIAILLGLFAGTFLIVIGVFGLIFVSSPSAPLRVTIEFAISSGISILGGLAVLRRTLRKENNAWLLPLRVFTDLVLRRLSLSADHDKTRRSGNVQ